MKYLIVRRHGTLWKTLRSRLLFCDPPRVAILKWTRAFALIERRSLQKKNKKWKTENENVHFCGEMDVEGSNENFVPRMERPEKHLPRLINATKAKAHRIKNRFTRERPTTCIGLEPSEQQEIVRNHGWSSNHSKNQKESMKYPVPPPKDGIWQKRKKRRRANRHKKKK